MSTAHTDSPSDPASMRRFFESGITRSYTWRREQLLRLRAAVQHAEQEIAAALQTDLGKSPEEAYGTETGLVLAEISTLLSHLKKWMRPQKVPTNLANLPGRSRIYRDPLGAVLIIAPWNYPLQLALLPLAGALAGGNTVVIKPSEFAPATAALIEKILTSAFRPDIVRVVQGEGARLIPQLMKDFRFNHIFFTGSIPVGRAVYQLAAEQLIPVTLELGGKSPAVIEPDADITVTANRIVFGKFTNAGQTCIAPDYLLVHVSVKDKLLEALRQSIRRFYGDDPAESGDYGRIIHEKRFDKLLSYLSQGRILAGGRHDREHLYIEPTILEAADPKQPLLQEEIFGPILPVVTYETMPQALEIIRSNPDPLAFYLFTRDRQKAREWIGSLRFGGGCVNNTEWHFANPHLPFGGVGASGIGRYHGRHSFETFTHAKGVLYTPWFPDLALKYPPFKGKMKWFKRFLR